MPRALPPVATVYQLMLLPAEVAVRLEVAPTHNVEGVAVTAVGAAGSGDTVSVAVTLLVQPLVTVYVITEVPAATPVTTPLVASIAATLVVALLQLPPLVLLANVVTPAGQIFKLPVIGVDTESALTVSVFCAVTVPPQPPVTVYMILDVPAETAVTTPVVAFTVATAVLLLLHAPVPPLSTTVLAV